MAIMPLPGIKENLTNHLQNQMEEHIECVLNTGTRADVMNALQCKKVTSFNQSKRYSGQCQC